MDSDAIRKLLDEATPGPWVIGPGTVFEEGPGLEKLPASIDAKDGTEVLYGCGCCGSPNMNWANARLIAATPELAAEVLRLRDRLIAEEEAKIRLAYVAAEEIGKLKDLLTEALPCVEAQLDDPANKPGTVRAIASRIRAALKAKLEGAP